MRFVVYCLLCLPHGLISNQNGQYFLIPSPISSSRFRSRIHPPQIHPSSFPINPFPIFGVILKYNIFQFPLIIFSISSEMKLFPFSLIIPLFFQIQQICSLPNNWKNIFDCLQKTNPREREGSQNSRSPILNEPNDYQEIGSTSGTKMDEKGENNWEKMDGINLERALTGEDSKILGFISQINSKNGKEEKIVEIHGRNSVDLGKRGGLSPIVLQRSVSESRKDKITWSQSIVPPLIKHKSEDITKIMRKFTKKNKKFKKKKYKKYEDLCSEEQIKKLGKIKNKYKNNSSIPDEQPKCLFLFNCAKKIKNERKLDRKEAIRMALRKYLCDKINKKLDTNWIYSADDEKEKREGEVEKLKKSFKKNDSELPHQFEFDFTFTVFFPSEFDELSQKFGLDDPTILLVESLTAKSLKGLNFDSKGGCQLFASFDEKFFLKSVRMKPKERLPLFNNKLEPIVEKDFFFKHKLEDNKHKFMHWTEEERRMAPPENAFRGGFNDYFDYIKNPSRETLLPKYFMLFHFEPILDNQKREPTNPNQIPMLFTIQNGLFPEGIPKLEYKFDLKGSRTDRLAAENKTILKDQNFVKFERNERKGFFPNGIELSDENYTKITKMIEDDSEFLSKLTIIDYSLLMGVHLVESEEELNENINDDGGYWANAKMLNGNENTKLRIFLGIIDILQPYILAKKVEAGLKSKLKLGKSISFDDSMHKYMPMSVTSPEEYKQRFREFITSVVFRQKYLRIWQILAKKED